jgi:hypothetical protein
MTVNTGIITERSSDEIAIFWNNGQVDRVRHTDMREVE